jgi:hypothetical protein
VGGGGTKDTLALIGEHLTTMSDIMVEAAKNSEDKEKVRERAREREEEKLVELRLIRVALEALVKHGEVMALHYKAISRAETADGSSDSSGTEESEELEEGELAGLLEDADSEESDIEETPQKVDITENVGAETLK